MGTLKKKSFSRLKTEDSEVFKPKTKAKKKHTHSWFARACNLTMEQISDDESINHSDIQRDR